MSGIMPPAPSLMTLVPASDSLHTLANYRLIAPEPIPTRTAPQ